MTACTRKHCSYAKCFCPSLTSFYQQVFVDLTVTHLTFSSYAAELTCFAPNVAQTSCGPRAKTQRVKSQWRPSPSFLIWHSRRQTRRSPCPVEEYTVAVLSSQNPTIIAAIFFYYYFVLGTSKMALFILSLYCRHSNLSALWFSIIWCCLWFSWIYYDSCCSYFMKAEIFYF